MLDKIKKISLKIGRGLLVFFGVISFIGLLFGQFEESLTISEISILEFIFWGLLISLCWHHYLLCNAVNMDLKTTFYLPLRNIGWIFLVELLVLIGILIFLNNKIVIFYYKNENIYQIIQMAIFLLCIYFASPKQEVVK